MRNFTAIMTKVEFNYTLLYMRTKKSKKSKVEIIVTGNIFEVAHQTHHVVVRYCEYCGKPMSESDVNDFGSLCESCYMKEYYDEN